MPAAVGWGQAEAGTGGNTRLTELNQYFTGSYLGKPFIPASRHFRPADWTPVDTLIELTRAEIGPAEPLASEAVAVTSEVGRNKEHPFLVQRVLIC